jgi:hypothetical protein
MESNQRHLINPGGGGDLLASAGGRRVGPGNPNPFNYPPVYRWKWRRQEKQLGERLGKK